MMVETFRDRLYGVFNELNMTEHAFEVQCGLANGTMNRVKNGKGVSVEQFAKVLRTYPSIDAYWLATGQKDPKFSDETKKGTDVPVATNKAEIAPEIESFYQEQIRRKDETINRLLALLEKGENKISQSISYGNDRTGTAETAR